MQKETGDLPVKWDAHFPRSLPKKTRLHRLAVCTSLCLLAFCKANSNCSEMAPKVHALYRRWHPDWRANLLFHQARRKFHSILAINTCTALLPVQLSNPYQQDWCRRAHTRKIAPPPPPPPRLCNSPTWFSILGGPKWPAKALRCFQFSFLKTQLRFYFCIVQSQYRVLCDHSVHVCIQDAEHTNYRIPPTKSTLTWKYH